ncbi:MAG: hypothetical protein ACLUYS_00555 [Allobaculum sp.]|uniref:hypothetical protein n=1 Tax=Allobaculum sp. TaxID=1872463 RepID=UPI00399A1D7D
MNLYTYIYLPAVESYRLPGFSQAEALPVLIQIREANLPLDQTKQLCGDLVQTVCTLDSPNSAPVNGSTNSLLANTKASANTSINNPDQTDARLEQKFEQEREQEQEQEPGMEPEPLETRLSKTLEQARQTLQAEKAKKKTSHWVREGMDLLLFVPLWIAIKQVLINLWMDPFFAHEALPMTMHFGPGDLISALGVYVVAKLLIACIARYPKGWKRWLTIVLCLIGFLGSDYVGRMNWPGAITVSPWSVLLVCAVVFALAYVWHGQVFGNRKNEPRIS